MENFFKSKSEAYVWRKAWIRKTGKLYRVEPVWIVIDDDTIFGYTVVEQKPKYKVKKAGE
jgi:hypothetical protein